VEQDGQFVAIWLHCIQTFIESENIIHMCARIMSISTQSDVFCIAIQRKEKNWMLHIAQAIERYMKRSEIVVRFMYAIGNGAVACEHCRHAKFIKTVRRVLSHYIKNNKFGKSETDVILKSIRVCANFALEEDGANALVADAPLIKLHIKLFGMILDDKGKFAETDELLKFIIAALNNIIYFTSINFEHFASEVASLFIRVRNTGGVMPFFKHNELHIIVDGRNFSNLRAFEFFKLLLKFCFKSILEFLNLKITLVHPQYFVLYGELHTILNPRNVKTVIE